MLRRPVICYSLVKLSSLSVGITWDMLLAHRIWQRCWDVIPIISTHYIKLILAEWGRGWGAAGRTPLLAWNKQTAML